MEQCFSRMNIIYSESKARTEASCSSSSSSSSARVQSSNDMVIVVTSRELAVYGDSNSEAERGADL